MGGAVSGCLCGWLLVVLEEVVLMVLRWMVVLVAVRVVGARRLLFRCVDFLLMLGPVSSRLFLPWMVSRIPRCPGWTWSLICPLMSVVSLRERRVSIVGGAYLETEA